MTPVAHLGIASRRHLIVGMTANPDANELARKAADDVARDFQCGKDEVKVIGESGRAVGMAVQR